MFVPKPVVFISGVGSGMDSGCSVRVSGFGSVLPGLRGMVYIFKDEIKYVVEMEG